MVNPAAGTARAVCWVGRPLALATGPGHMDCDPRQEVWRRDYGRTAAVPYEDFILCWGIYTRLSFLDHQVLPLSISPKTHIFFFILDTPYSVNSPLSPIRKTYGLYHENKS